MPAALVAAALAVALYVAGVPARPPGFYLDESSIAYNAHTISRRGVDEHGEPWPLFFRAFGEYKNPVYLYLLAAVFRLTGPSITAARLLSAAAGLAAAALLGLLAWRVTRRRGVGLMVCLSALVTPWLYENSRLVFEAALYPAAVALFLLALRRASERERWSTADAALLGLGLALVTYTYTVGRLLGPLLACGLVLFATRRNRAGVARAWLAYFVTLVPLLVFNRRYPGALAGRFMGLTYVTPQSGAAEVAFEFVRHYAANLSPWRLLVTGEENLRDHVPGMGVVLLPTLLLSTWGLYLIFRRLRRDPWWRFVVYGAVVSAVPASLTVNPFPMLRLAALPVFLLLLAAPAFARLSEDDGGAKASVGEGPAPRRAAPAAVGRRVALAALLALTLLQAAWFQWLFHRGGPERGYIFDSHYPRVLATAAAEGRRPIYLRERPGGVGYIQAYWYGTLAGLDRSQFARLPAGERPPPGAVVISTEESCERCRLIMESVNYIVYEVAGEPGAGP